MSLPAVKQVREEIQKPLGSEELVIYNQFEGKTLRRDSGVRRSPCWRGGVPVSAGGGESGYSGEEKGTSVQYPACSSF